MRFFPLPCLVLVSCAVPPAHDPDVVHPNGGKGSALLVHAPYDPAQHATTCKPWHRVFAPDGRQLTKDLGGEFEHHRGLFVGWNLVRWHGQHLDFWHCHGGETQRFVGFAADAPPAAQVALIEWRTKAGELVLRERRTLRTWDCGDDAFGLELAHEFAADDEVVLDGDPQHAGQQFRALQQFAEKDATPVSYLRPAGAEAHANDVWTGCDWIAGVLPLTDGPVTVLRVEGRDNPRPTTWSTRAYGRFGATFTTTIPAGGTLRFADNYVVAEGARDMAWCEATATAVARRP